MKTLFLILFLFGISLNVPAAGFEGGMLTLDPTIMSTNSGENNNVPVAGSLVYVATSNNLDSITGFDQGMAKGALMLVANASASNNLVIKNNSSSSLANNRIITVDGQDITLPPSNTEILGYDAASQKWYVQRVPDVSISFYKSTPSDPGTTTSSAGVMMGLAGAITPNKSGNIEVNITGYIENNTLADGAQVQIRYGTGTAPTNGSALTGTAIGSPVKQVNPTLALLVPGGGPFSLSYIAQGLTLSTATWVDVSLARITGGTAKISGLSMTIKEI